MAVHVYSPSFANIAARTSFPMRLSRPKNDLRRDLRTRSSPTHRTLNVLRARARAFATYVRSEAISAFHFVPPIRENG